MLKKILYPLDLRGDSLQNRIDGEMHTIGRDRWRAFAVNYGFFYSESVTIRDRTNNRVLVQGKDKDFVCLYYLRSVSEISLGKKEVCGVILIVNEDVSTDLEVGYQLVGGHYANYSASIEEAIALLELDNRNVYWANVLARPDLFTPAPHPHDVGDVYGFEYIIDVLGYIFNGIMIGDNEVHNQILAALDKLRIDLTNAHQAHLADKGNPHGSTAEQVGAYTKAAIDDFLTAIGARFDALEPRFTAILTSITNLTNRITADEAAITALGARVGVAEGDIGRLFAQLGDNSDAIELINSAITSINNEITALKAKDTNLQSQITTANGEIAAIKVVNSNQDGRLTAIEAKNVQQDNRLTNLESGLASTNSNFANYVPWSSVSQSVTGYSSLINKVPYINGAGVLEICTYLDRHVSGSTADYSVREQVQYNSAVGGYEIFNTGFYNCIDMFIRSDERDKDGITDIDPEHAAEMLREIRGGIRYRLRGVGQVTAGLSAQRIQKVFPEGVSEMTVNQETGEKRLTLRNGAINGLMASGWFYLDSEHLKLKDELKKTNKTVSELEQSVKKIKKALQMN